MSTHRLLLTGANGFLGSHILEQLLPRENVSVRAVVRSESKINAVKHDFGQYENLDFAIVPDITSENAFHDALTKTDVPFDSVIHSASPFLYTKVDDNREFLDPAVKGTTEILTAGELHHRQRNSEYSNTGPTRSPAVTISQEALP